MGAVGGLLGTAGGANGTGFGGPANATILNPATVAQANTQYGNAQQGLTYQQQLVQALQAQNGLQNQSSVYNQLQGVANGTGPNPAQAQLAQATGANVANQAAMMAGQRGAGSNVGLMARQAAQQGAATQQNAAGQAATLQAQQSLNALQGMGSLANQQTANQLAATQGYSQSAQNEQANVLNAIANQNNANIGMQSNINNTNASLAGITMQGQQNMMGGLMNQGMGGGMSSMFAEGGEVDDDSMPDAPAPDMTTSQAPAPVPSTPTAVPVGVAPAPNPGQVSIPSIQNAFAQKSGGGGGGSGGGLSSLIGMVAMMAEGGGVQVSSGPNIGSVSMPTIQNAFKFNTQKSKPASTLGKQISGSAEDPSVYDKASGFTPDQMAQEQDRAAAINAGAIPAATSPYAQVNNSYGGGNQTVMQAADNSDNSMAEGGKVPALLSPGERYLPPKEAKEVASGKKDAMSAGKKVPGKPKVTGAVNSYKNDTVPATLEEGGIVIPRSVTQSKNPHWEAMKFVRAHMAKNRKGM